MVLRSWPRCVLCFHSYASRIGSKKTPSSRGGFEQPRGKSFPFIRFTNWKQVGKECWVIDSLVFPFIRFTNWKQGVVDTIFAALICPNVSIHTLHELEARTNPATRARGLLAVSIHTLHELEARNPNTIRCWSETDVFPFIRFTNWKQEANIEMLWERIEFPFIRFTNWKQEFILVFK